MWAGTGESEESPASALDGDGQSRELGENLHRESGVAFTPRVKLWGRIANKARVSCSLVCGGVIDSWLIVHQKIAVSGLGESSPCGCLPFKPAQFHRAPVDTVSLIPVREEGVKARVRHFKAFFAKLRGFAFYLKVSF